MADGGRASWAATLILAVSTKYLTYLTLYETCSTNGASESEERPSRRRRKGK
jgi:hypothetical protein